MILGGSPQFSLSRSGESDVKAGRAIDKGDLWADAVKKCKTIGPGKPARFGK